METNQEKRNFLAVAAKFSAVAATLGAGGTVILAARSDAAVTAPIQSLLHTAVQTGDMDMAIKQYGEQCKLDATQLKALQSLSRQELNSLKSIQQKLLPLGDQINSLKIVF